MTAEPIHDLTVHDVPVGNLKAYGDNPRVGNVDAIAESLRVNGQFRPIVVRKETSEILAGNHTWKAARSLGWTHIRVTFVEDITDEQATRIVLADNRYSDLASYDDESLGLLLASLDGDYVGTGYDLESVDKLIDALTKTETVPDFRPEDEQVNPPLDSRIRYSCPHCDGNFEMVSGKPKAVDD
jgi:ParB-like chromosome segregation protein Spo0J